MAILKPKNNETTMLRVKTVNGAAEVYVRIDGRDYEIEGISRLKIDQTKPSRLLTVHISATPLSLGSE